MRLAVLFAFFTVVTVGQVRDPDELLREAERLAWLKNWSQAEPLFAEAEKASAARGDRRNELYARVNRLRGELPRLSVADVSGQLGDLLEDPIVQGDDRLRLRVLTIKGETDEDFDPDQAEQSWKEALAIAERLGENAWANRAKGELALITGLQGNMGAAATGLISAVQKAQKLGDTPSVVRWTTIFAQGLAQFGRAQETIQQYDRALAVAATVPELSFPVMTYLGKGAALAKLGRRQEAETVLQQALEAAETRGAYGYQASIRTRLADLKAEGGQRAEAIRELDLAMDLARRAGGRRLAAETGLSKSKLLLADGRVSEAASASDEAIRQARAINEQLLLPKLLAHRGDIDLRQGHPERAIERVDEATDVLEGLLAGVSSPWLQSRLIGAMNDVYSAAIRIHGQARSTPAVFFATVERARGRAFSSLAVTSPSTARTPERRAAERELARLQSQLFATTNRRQRRALLDQILQKEIDLTPALAESGAISLRAPLALTTLRARLRPDEVLLEFAIVPDESYCLVVTPKSARIEKLNLPKSLTTESVNKALSAFPEIAKAKRVIVVPDGPMHQIPLETASYNGRLMLESHVVSYSPSGSTLAALRNRRPARTQGLLAVASTPAGTVTGPVMRGVYDIEPGKLPPLASATREAEAVSEILGLPGSKILIPPDATEANLKSQPMRDVAVLHFASHGITSSRFPERSALLLEAGSPNEDGLLQAREILGMRLNAELVTLSACETAAGDSFGQEGVASLVRPFLAAGARSVVANLWAVEDAFSLALMKEFYRLLAAGADKGEALRQAKLKMIAEFGADATPKLWGGVVIFGDSTGTISAQRRAQ